MSTTITTTAEPPPGEVAKVALTDAMQTRGPTVGKARFGQKRTLGCECDYRFTCRGCLDIALKPGPG